MFFFFFFFQAEDGIRDHCVTGVQTCALPISPPLASNWPTKDSGRADSSNPAKSNTYGPVMAGTGVVNEAAFCLMKLPLPVEAWLELLVSSIIKPSLVDVKVIPKSMELEPRSKVNTPRPSGLTV